MRPTSTWAAIFSNQGPMNSSSVMIRVGRAFGR
jgi:hypothetical protein